MNKEKAYLFDKALKYHGMTKKEFAEKSEIPYDTVAGWKRSGNVPNYAFVLLKKISFIENPRRHQLKLLPVTHIEITDKLVKEIQVAFWGKNYEPTMSRPIFLKKLKREILTLLNHFLRTCFTEIY